MNILEELRKNFKKIGITLKNDADSIKQYTMQDSVTNQFLKVVDTKGKPYLARINGKLWPPFTREGEHYNLNKLEEKSIASGVLVNNTLMGFQICNFYPEDQRFSKMPRESQEKYLKNIARTIKQFHQIPYFKNEYSISSTIYNTLKRLSSTQQDKFSPFYKVILSLLTTLNADKENYVASHNDLLPSSIYINEEGITIVDWEYSAMNHRSYDLSLLSIKSSFTPEQEQTLVESYNGCRTEDLRYSVAMMKPIVNFYYYFGIPQARILIYLPQIYY